MKAFAKKFYKSDKWLKCREAYIKHRIAIDGGMCEVCKDNLGYIVHHKVPLTPENIDNPNITLNFKYLQYDCKKCHDREDVHPIIKDKQLNCEFDENGNPIPKEGDD